jgi:hypothetical protein
MKTRYRAAGSVRGSCGHAHLSVVAAYKCAQKDQRDCASLPGGNAYSDRHVVRMDGQPLDEHEREQMYAYMDAHPS